MALQGRNASVKLDAGVNTVSDLYNWSLDLTSDPITQPVFGDIWSITHGLAVNNWSGSFDGIFDEDDTNGQIALRNAQINGTVVSGVRFYLDTSTHYYEGDVYITSHNPNTSTDDVARITFNFQGTGELAFT